MIQSTFRVHWPVHLLPFPAETEMPARKTSKSYGAWSSSAIQDVSSGHSIAPESDSFGRSVRPETSSPLSATPAGLVVVMVVVVVVVVVVVLAAAERAAAVSASIRALSIRMRSVASGPSRTTAKGRWGGRGCTGGWYPSTGTGDMGREGKIGGAEMNDATSEGVIWPMLVTWINRQSPGLTFSRCVANASTLLTNVV